MSAENVHLVVCDVDGTLTDGVIGINDRGEEYKNFSVVDGMGIRLLMDAGIEVALLSARSCPAVDHRARGLGIRLCLTGVSRKKQHLEDLIRGQGLEPEQVCYIGDDVNDLPCLRMAGFPVAVANAHAEVRKQATYVTSAVGGQGAVREVAELVLEARGLLKSALEKFS